MDPVTLLLLGSVAYAFLKRGPGTSPVVTPTTSGIIGAVPGILPGTVLPPGAMTTPIVFGGSVGTVNPNPVTLGSGVVSPTQGTGTPSSGVSVSRGTLSLDQIAKLAASAMKKAAALFRRRQEGSLDSSTPVSSTLDAESLAAWDAYRRGEWSVTTDGTIVIEDADAPLLNATIASLDTPTMLDVPLLVPSDYMLLNEQADLSGLTGDRAFDVDVATAFTSDSPLLPQMAHEEMRLYIDALPPDRATAFVSDAAASTGYTMQDVMNGLNVLGIAAGTLSLAKGISAGDIVGALGGAVGIMSNFVRLMGYGSIPGLGVVSGLLGIAAGVMSNDWIGVVSGTIGTLTGILSPFATAELASLALEGMEMGLVAGELVATETVLMSTMAFLSVVSVVLVVIGFMMSNDMAMAADQLAAEAHEFRTINKDMAVAWPQLVNGHKAALLLQFVPMLPPARQVEALQGIFSATQVGLGAGPAISKFLGAAGPGQFGTGNVSQYEAVSGLYTYDCIIGTMRTEEALMRLGRQAEPAFYPFGYLDLAQLMYWVFTDVGVQAPVWTPGEPIDGMQTGTWIERTPSLREPYGAPILLDRVIPPTIPPMMPYYYYDEQGTPYPSGAMIPNPASPGSGFKDAIWKGNMEELLMRVIAVYNPLNWQQTPFGQRLTAVGTYPVNMPPEREASVRLQYEYWHAVYDSDNAAVIPDPWYNPAFIVPSRAAWPAPAAPYVDPTTVGMQTPTGGG